MKQSRLKSLKWVLLAGLLAGGLLPALAGATPVTFDINGHFSNIDIFYPVNGTFTGTMDVDTSTGDLLSFDVLFPGLAAFNAPTNSSGGLVFPVWTIGANNADGDYLSLAFTTPQVPTFLGFGHGSLVGFAGGSIFGNDVLFSIHGIPVLGGGFSGSITPARVSVPEPAALGMFGAGVLLIGLFAGLRRRVG